ncbi:hypothetical protein RHMOL_Rhmol04G0346900 [Rhododendron molle]|uniref:Uncharacterized protein n=1 Tax=Rhododendron molle TaxID=49168 RepID=A0ACC0P8J3_RHOML|nr:hypothetical protein RHMOL_Rhmol04G0346900 [Rhododendron molle]
MRMSLTPTWFFFFHAVMLLRFGPLSLHAMGLLSCPVDLSGVLVGPGSSEEEIHWLAFYSKLSSAQQFYCLWNERNGRVFQTQIADC